MPPLVLDGTNGVSGVDGTASNPSYEGTDSNTGIFYPAADTVAIGTGGTERLRVDSAGNAGLATTSINTTVWGSTYPKLAIGTTTNAGVLQFESTAAAANNKYLGGVSALNLGSGVTANESADILFYQDGTSATNPGGRISFFTRTDAGSVAEKMRLDSSGNLGLGVTPSGKSKFEVATGNVAQNGVQVWYNSSNTPIALANTTSNAFPYVGFNTVQKTSSDNQTYAIGNYASRLKAYGGGFSFDIAGSGTAGTDITWTQAMTLDASGILLVGTTSASASLAAGGLQVTDRICVGTGSVGTPSLHASGDTNTGLYFPGADIVGFATGGTERARITSGGEFLVGKTASGIAVGVESRANGYLISSLAASTNASSSLDLYSTGAGAYRFYVGLGGTIFATSTTISAISDQRLKENIQDLDVGLDAIMALKPRKFDWKEGKGKNIKGDRGWIAQEFEQVFPDMIGTWKDESPEGEEPYKSVGADLIPILVKAIQELNAKVEAQAAEIAALKGNA